MEFEKINKINGKPIEETEEYYRLNQFQVLQKNKKGGYKIIYPIQINDEKVNKRNLFAGAGFGTFIWIFLMVLGILLILYNYNLNLKECTNILSNPKEFCSNVCAIMK